MVEGGSVVSKLCKYCSGNVDTKGTKFLKCRDCESVYHYSCSKRVKNIKVVDIQNYLMVCCEMKDPDDKKTSSGAGGETEIYKLEISYLKSLINEKDARISELIKINCLLEEKLKLANISKGLEEHEKKVISRKDNSISSYAKVAGKKLSDGHKQKADKEEYPQKCATEEIVNKQLSVMENLIYLNEDPVTEKYETQTRFRQTDGRNRMNRQSTDGNRDDAGKKPGFSKYAGTRGSAPPDPDNMFKARPSKMWLYVGKVAETVEEAHVINYITKKCSIKEEDQVIVRKLPLLGRSRAFQVGIDPKFYDELNKSEFWPNGVIIRRFNFRFKRDASQQAAFLEDRLQNSAPGSL